jgi:uncharacterized membrane protein YbhN (UPF0104 family)
MRAWKVFKWVLLVLLVGGLARYVYSHLEEFKVIREASVGLISAQIALCIALLILNAIQSFIVLKSFGLSIPFSAWFRIAVYARFLNRFFPQAGNAYRLGELKLSHGFPISRYLASFAAFSVLNRLLTLLYVLVIVLIWKPGLAIAGFNIGALLFFILLAACAGLIVARTACRFGRARWSEYSKYVDRIAELMECVVQCFINPRIIGGVFVLSLASLFISVYANWLCFEAFGASVSFPALAILKFAKSTTDSVSVTPGNVGVTETLYGVLGQELQSGAAVSILVAAFLNITAIIGVALITGVLMLFSGARGGSGAETQSSSG